MYRVAWWTCALIALIDARIYERCELARDLQALGVDPDNIATWVCIAYHESRFDTAASNSYSGDHGLFQISELYWCGPGKACGLQCAALRDEDISDDLECALQVHEEHTRLQGNGFLAWVVYPQHCKHNTKKYLVDCDTAVKNPSPLKPRTFTYNNHYSNLTTFRKHNVEDLVPPYLAVSALFRANYGKVLDHSKGRVDWINYKVDNIDGLKLPVFGETPAPVTTPRPTTSTTTTTTTVYIPPVKPWRTIETNQFRKKAHFNDNHTTKKENIDTFEDSTPSTTSTTKQPSTTTTTLKPFSAASTTLQNVATITTSKPFIFTTTTLRPTSRPTFSSFSSTRAPTLRTTETQRFFTTTARPWTFTTPRLTTTTRKPYVTTTSPTVASSTYKPFAFTYKPQSTTTRQPYSWYTFTSRTSSTPATTKFAQTSTPRSVTTTTRKPLTTTQKARTTQNIFDLYLHPTKPPKLPAFQFSSDSDNSFKLRIFSSGTTTSAPGSEKWTNGDQKREYGGATKNYIRRQTLESDTA